MKRKMKDVSLSINMIEKCEGADYRICALAEIKFLRAQRYAIYLEYEGIGELELFSSDEEYAREIYEEICKGELSPIHLKDVAYDMKF